MKKWTMEELTDSLKINVKDYGSAIAVAAMFKKMYGAFPRIGLSGAQAEMADQLIEFMPEARSLAAEKTDEATEKECNDCAETVAEKHKIVTKNVTSLQQLHTAKMDAYRKAEGKPVTSQEYNNFCEASDRYNEAERKDPFAGYMLGLIAYKKKQHGCHILLGEVLKEYLSSRHPAPADKEPLAVLAKRKGKAIAVIPPTEKLGWEISVDIPYDEDWISEDIFIGPTYEAAEAKARAWLEAQGGK